MSCAGAAGSCNWAAMPGGAVTITFVARTANERVMVLADVSQSLGKNLTYPPEITKVVELEEVVEHETPATL